MNASAENVDLAISPLGPWPEDQIMVLRGRRLRPDARGLDLPRFGDPVWRLRAAREDAHTVQETVHWEKFPAEFILPAKTVALAMLDHRCPPGMFPGSGSILLSVSTIYARLQSLRVVCQWLADRGITSLDQVGDRELDSYLSHVLSLAKSPKRRGELLAAVCTTWGFRRHLPDACCFATDNPWDGATPHELTRVPARSRENKTPRIDEATMESLLAWSLRVIEEFAPDITAAWTKYRDLRGGTHSSQARYAGLPQGQRVDILLDQVRESTVLLPGRARADGSIAVDQGHVRRLINARNAKFTRAQLARLDQNAAEGPSRLGQISAMIGEAARREVRITVENVKRLVRHLVTACFIVVCYLSGMRPGETLNLHRGCRQIDQDGQMLVLGNRGKPRRTTQPDPRPDRSWVVVAPVHGAIEVLEQLSTHRFLFPSSNVMVFRTRMPSYYARTTGRLTEDIDLFIAWINQTFSGEDSPAIPPDPVKHIHPRRLRRTLAYFIVRRPRGLIAAALQYGHVSTRVTLSYAGAADDSWMEDLAVERLEMIVDHVERDWSLLQDSEHVSGGAAHEYQARVERAAARFAGRVVTAVRSVERLLTQADPSIHHGEGMTCVWRAETAACRKEKIELGLPPNDAPDESRCRSTCQNLAYTDRDIDRLRSRLDVFNAAARDPLSPRPQRDRAADLAGQVRAIIERHEQTRLTGRVEMERA